MLNIIIDNMKENIKKVLDAIKVETNAVNDGACCFFNYEGKEYWADLTYLPIYGSECMIFPSENGGVTSWSELYCKRGISVCGTELKECVREFLETMIQDKTNNNEL